MEINIDQTRWYDRIWAALIFFTRLPFWRLHEPPRECYKSVVEHWPLAGWITGGIMAATLYFGSMVMPYLVAVVLAVVVRLLVTGALHEDGLADFLDGFGGGGKDRDRILAIMKDSHIGTYGVLGLVRYGRPLRQDGDGAAHYDDAIRTDGRGGKEQDRLSPHGLAGRHQFGTARSAARGGLCVSHPCPLGTVGVHSLSGHVPALPAHLE